MDKDVEATSATASKPNKIPWMKMLVNQGVLTPEIIQHKYQGSGTEGDPYLTTWIENDPRDPMHFPIWIKWSLTQVVSFITLTVSFVSSAYSSGILEIKADLGGGTEVNTLGVSLFVFGFALGPFLWAPLSGKYAK